MEDMTGIVSLEDVIGACVEAAPELVKLPDGA
jgi:hypothetical protein